MLDRWAALPANVRELLLAAGFSGSWFGLLAAASVLGWRSGGTDSYVLAGAVTTVVLLSARPAPRTTLALVTVAYPLIYAGDFGTLRSDFHLLPALVAGYLVASTSTVAVRWVLPATLASVTTLVVSPAGLIHLARTLRSPARLVQAVNFSGAVFALTATGGVVLLGAAVRRLRRAAELLRARNAELQELRELESRQIVAAERARIARELHDVVAHHMSAVVIRAQAADRVFDRDPEATRDAVRWIASTGQEALASMRQVVRVLRASGPGDPAAARSPEVGLDSLPAIADRMTSAGLTVTLDLDEPMPELGPLVQLAAVRIVQEALTNSLVHAHATSASVRISADSTSVTLSVDDDGTVGPPRPAGASPTTQRSRAGHGLLGMRERAASCDGWLTVEGSPLGGWRVSARLSRAAA